MSDSMRDSINAALDAEDGNYEETAQEVLNDDTSEHETEEVSEPQDETILENVEATDESEAEDANKETQAASDDPDETESAKPLAGDSIKAPVDWGPQEREHWSKIPRNLQAKIIERENATQKLMQETSDARRTHQDFSALMQQYGSALSGVMGDTPMETTKNLFSTVANLRMGSPIQKAQIIADMITDFGVDINTLDSAIVGAAPSPVQTQNNQFEQMLNQRMQPFEQMMGQQNAYQQQQATQRTETANAEVAAFSEKAEFLGDVRDDMADLIEMAGNRGQTMTMQDAYNKACALNPQVSAVMQERKQREALNGNSNTMAGKRLAASSVNGQRIGNGSGGGENASMHDTISAAWDNQNTI